MPGQAEDIRNAFKKWELEQQREDDSPGATAGCKPINFKKTQWRIDKEHFSFEFSPFCWGVGFDIGYVVRFGASLWLGPFFFEVGL